MHYSPKFLFKRVNNVLSFFNNGFTIIYGMILIIIQDTSKGHWHELLAKIIFVSLYVLIIE